MHREAPTLEKPTVSDPSEAPLHDRKKAIRDQAHANRQAQPDKDELSRAMIRILEEKRP